MFQQAVFLFLVLCCSFFASPLLRGVSAAGDPLPAMPSKGLLPIEFFNDTLTNESLRIPLITKTRDGLDFAPALDANTSDNISSPFGPRWKVSKTRYDLHTGCDFFNATDNPYNIYSIGTGVVYKITNSTGGGGLTVYVHHMLPYVKDSNGQNAMFHNRTIGSDQCGVFSVYLHLELNSLGTGIVVGQNISRGQFIGKMGQTGDSVFTHLHLETRLCCYCSHSYTIGAHKSPSATSECNCGFDTHVNPFSFLPLPSMNGPRTIEEIQVLNSSYSFAVRYNASRMNLDLDVIRVYYPGENGTSVNATTLAFNWRAGFDTRSEAARDNWIHTFKPFLMIPSSFRSFSQHIFYDVHFPSSRPMPSKIEFITVAGEGSRWTAPTTTTTAANTTTTTSAAAGTTTNLTATNSSSSSSTEANTTTSTAEANTTANASTTTSTAVGTTTSNATTNESTSAASAAATNVSSTNNNVTSTSASTISATNSSSTVANTTTTTMSGASSTASNTSSASSSSSTTDSSAATTSTTVETTAAQATTAAAAGTTTTGASSSTSTTATTKKPSIVLKLTANATLTPVEIKNELAKLINVNPNSLVIVSSSSGEVKIEINGGANATTALDDALKLTPAQLNTLGAASVADANKPAPEESGLPVGAIIGIAIAGALILFLVLFLIKRNSSEGTGTKREGGGEEQAGHQMLVVPERGGANQL